VVPFRWLVMTIAATSMVGGSLAAAVQVPLRPNSIVLPGTDIVLEAGWRLVLTEDEACAFMVPATWPVALNHRWAATPDGHISATFDNPPPASWAMHKMRIRDAIRPTAVLDDSDRRLWVEFADERRILHHISLTDGRVICSADVQVQRSIEPTSDIVTKMISGMRVTRIGDLLWLRK